jgi:signal transduction histidine kinase
MDATYLDSINDLRDIDKKVSRAAGELKDLLDERETLASKNMSRDGARAVSHDLRTPLNAIIGFSELLLSTDNDVITEQLLELLETIHSSALELLDVIVTVLEKHEF